MSASPPRGDVPRCTSPPNQSAPASSRAGWHPAIAMTLMIACSQPQAEVPMPAPAAPVVAPVPAVEPAPLAILDHAIPWTPVRESLTVEYLAAHRTTALSGDPERDTRMAPQVVVLHWTAGPTAKSAWNTFAPARLAGRAELQGAGALNVGAHYLVDRDGTIERLFPEDRVVRHCIGLNHIAIGIENVGGGAEWPLTDAQVEANVALVRDIAGRHAIRWVVGHQESDRIEALPVYEERDPSYRNAKPDPGEVFTARVRAGVGDLPP